MSTGEPFDPRSPKALRILREAIDEADTAKVQQLLNCGMPINTRLGFLRRTPLLMAVEDGNLYMVRWFLEHGANPNIPDMHGRTPLQYVQPTSYPEYPTLFKAPTREIHEQDERVRGIIRNMLLRAGAC